MYVILCTLYIYVYSDSYRFRHLLSLEKHEVYIYPTPLLWAGCDTKVNLAHSAGAIENTDCISAEG